VDRLRGEKYAADLNKRKPAVPPLRRTAGDIFAPRGLLALTPSRSYTCQGVAKQLPLAAAGLAGSGAFTGKTRTVAFHHRHRDRAPWRESGPPKRVLDISGLPRFCEPRKDAEEPTFSPALPPSSRAEGAAIQSRWQRSAPSAFLVAPTLRAPQRRGCGRGQAKIFQKPARKQAALRRPTLMGTLFLIWHSAAKRRSRANTRFGSRA
jgi:hypothetical protein